MERVATPPEPTELTTTLADLDCPTLRLGGVLPVRRMGYGAMRICGEGVWGEPADREAARKVLRRAVELGVDLIDTADSYGPGVSEELIHEALHPYPEGLVLATKAGLVRPGPGRWDPDGRPEHIREACEGSLRRLGVDCIDLYQFHRPDPAVPLEESLGAFVELRAEGKIRLIGLSNVGVDQLEAALEVTDVASVQNRYNLADRTSDDVLDRCDELGIAFLPWFPLAVGELARSDGALEAIASRRRMTRAQVALAWLLARSPVTVPIPGTASVEHLEENLAACATPLDDADLALIG